MAEYSSFYGGRRGASFIIKKSYPCVTYENGNLNNDPISMLDDFKTASCEVNFGEYVLINTENKNDPNNGALYRRGLDINSNRTIPYWSFNGEIWEKKNDLLAYGAEYIGTISGPSGRAPKLMVKDYEDIDQENTGGLLNKGALKGAPRFIKEDDEITLLTRVVNYNSSILTSEDKNILRTGTLLNDINKKPIFDNINGLGDDSSLPDLLPGKYNLIINSFNVQEGTIEEVLYQNIYYNNDIQYVSATMVDSNNQESIAYIGFKFPYPVLDFYTESVKTYRALEQGESQPSFIDNDDNAGMSSSIEYEYYDDTSKIEEEPQDGVFQAFSSKYKISIPKGVHGQNLQNLRVVILQYIQESNNDRFLIKEDDETNQIRLYDKNNNLYSNSQNNLTQILPDYYFDNNNILVNDYQNLSFQAVIYDIQNFDKTNPGIIRSYFLGSFNQIDNIQIDEYGTIKVEYSSMPTQYFPCKVRWIYNIVCNQQPAIVLNNEANLPQYYSELLPITTQEETEIPHVEEARYENENLYEGVLTVLYNTITKRQIENSDSYEYHRDYEVFQSDYVKHITISQDGEVKYFHTDENKDVIDEQRLEWIDYIDIETKSDENNINKNYLNFYLNTEHTNPYKQFNFDFIKEITFDESKGQFTFTYSSGHKTFFPSANNAIKYPTEITFDETGGTVNFNIGEPETFSVKQLDYVKNIDGYSGSVSNIESVLTKLFPNANKWNNATTDQKKAIRALLHLNDDDTRNTDTFSTLNNFFEVKYKGIEETETEKIIEYSDGYNEIEKIVISNDKPAKLLVLYSSIEKRIDLILGNSGGAGGVYTIPNETGAAKYTYLNDIGWKILGTLNSISAQDINFGWDITDGFYEYIAGQELSPLVTEHVIQYLNITYPFGLLSIDVPVVNEIGEITNETVDFKGHLVTLQVGQNEFYITDQGQGQEASSRSSEIIGSTIFVPWEWTQEAELKSTMFSEPIRTFYGYNYDTEIGTITLNTQITGNPNLESIRAAGSLPMIAGPMTNGNLYTETQNEGQFTYTYLKYKGWYNVNNILNGSALQSYSGSSSGQGNVNIYVGAETSYRETFDKSQPGTLWLVTT